MATDEKKTADLGLLEEDDAFDTDDVCFEGGRDNQVFTFNYCFNRATSHLKKYLRV